MTNQQYAATIVESYRRLWCSVSVRPGLRLSIGAPGWTHFIGHRVRPAVSEGKAPDSVNERTEMLCVDVVARRGDLDVAATEAAIVAVLEKAQR